MLPTPEQATALRKTLELTNKACNRLSELAWEAKEFRRFPLQRLFYRQIRDECGLSAQVVVRLIAKVCDAYNVDRDREHVFRKDGSIAYDSRILSLKVSTSTASIWTTEGRQKMAFVCGPRQRALLAYPWGECDLFSRNKKWFLNITVEIPEAQEIKAIDVLGVDFGIVEIASDSDGASYSGSKLNKVRHRNRSLHRLEVFRGSTLIRGIPFIAAL